MVLVLFINPFLSNKVTDIVTRFIGQSRIAYEAIYFVVQWSVALLFFFFGYRLLHYLMGFPRINKIITRTTLTTWKFWRRYKMPNHPVSANPKRV
jgi:hypothetical protein